LRPRFCISLLLSSVLACSCQGQQYDSLIVSAERFFLNKEYCKASSEYSNAFIAFGGKGYADDRYNAAMAWTLCGNNDSAFFNLFRLADKTNFLEYHKLMTENDFEKLHLDIRWTKLLSTVNPRHEIYNDSLAKILSEVRDNDQKYRVRWDSVEAAFGKESMQYKSLIKSTMYFDSVDLVIVTSIIDRFGWLSNNEVGSEGNSALWLVIQHADLETQKKYFPLMQAAVNNGKAQKKDLAYLEDRILMREGKKQLYGTQYHLDKNNQMTLWEVEDPVNLNKRRAEVGLPPM